MASSGNFATIGGLEKNSGGFAFSQGNLKYSVSTNNRGFISSTGFPDTGKWYYEMYIIGVGGAEDQVFIGVCNPDTMRGNLTQNRGGAQAPGSYGGYTYDQYHGYAVLNGTNQSADSIGYFRSFPQKVGILVNRDDNEIKWTFNGSSFSSAYTIPSGELRPYIGSGGGSNTASGVFNFGQDSTFGGAVSAGGNADSNGFGDFTFSVPSNYVALASANLPISDDIDPAQTDDDIPTKLCGSFKYTGSNGSAVTVSTGFQPDLIWIKSIDSTDNHYLQDSSRGFGNSKSLSPNATGGQGYNGGAPSSSGAQNVGSSSFQAYGSDWSRDTDNMISWCWRCNGGTTASNSNGQTTSTVQANQEAGFSIVQYAGSLTSSGTKTIGHGLSKAPEFIIIKNPDKNTGRWFVQHTGLTSWNYYLSLNTNNGETNSSGNGSMSDPTNTVFYTNYTEGSNENPYNHIAYCWHSVEGYSKFGKYTGNSDSDGPFIYTGFRPAIIMIKGLVSGSGWVIKDDTLDGFNPGTGILEPNQNSAKYTTAGGVCDILSNGFKVRTNNAVANSTSYDPYVYMAWGSVPFRYNNTF